MDPNTIVSDTSVACQNGATTDNGWWRLYDLDSDHRIFEKEFCTTDVDYGIETSSGGPQDLTANVFCLDDGLPFLTVFLTLAGTSTIAQPDADLEFFNIEVEGCCLSLVQSMAVELLSEDCLESGTCSQLFIGANDLGQTAPSYLSAPDCGLTDPTDLALVGSPDAHVIQIVNGLSDGTVCPCCGCGTPECDAKCGQLECVETCGVPTTTGPGLMLMILALLVASALVLRRVS